MRTWKTKSGYSLTRLLAGRSNVFLLSNGKRNILIDTSPATRWKRLDRNLRKQKVTEIDSLILTHTHYDHAQNAANIRQHYGAKVMVHSSEAGFLEKGQACIPGGTLPFTRALLRLIGQRMSRIRRTIPCPVDVRVDSVYSLEDRGFHAYILHTPGHSPGSISIIVDDEIAVVGDAMFGILRGSVFPPFADDTSLLVKSWGKLLETGCRVFLPAHGSARSRNILQAAYEKRKTYHA